MKIKKVLNNNAVIGINEKGQDIVVTGLGIAYQKETGENIEISKIERVFKVDAMENEGYNRYKELIDEIPKEFIELSEDILNYACSTFNKKVSDNTIITLADHLCFAVERVNNGLCIRTPHIWEVKRYYQDESISFQRMVTHLKFFAQRIVGGEGLIDRDDVHIERVVNNTDG